LEEQDTMRFAKLAAAAALLVAASVIGGTVIGGAVAAPRRDASAATPAADHRDRSPLIADARKYCDIFLETFAAKLGVERDAIVPAAKDAAKAAIDAAVAGGDLQADRATALKEKIDEADGQDCHVLRGRLHANAHGISHGFIHADVLHAAADALKLGGAALFSRLASGDSLQQVAKEQGVDYATVKADVLGAIDTDLKAAVDKGLNQDRADAVRDRVAAWLENGGGMPHNLVPRSR
jgi:hypothetical protein